MAGIVKRLVKRAARRWPALGLMLVRVTQPFRFRGERRAFAGGDVGEGNGKQSIVFFTHNRCGSVMLHRRLMDLMEGYGYQHRDYLAYVHLRPLEERDRFRRDEEEHRKVGRFRERGRYYGPLRYSVSIPDLERYKVLLVLRDPRDVLVSRYYSERFSHFRYDQRFLEHCREVEQMDLDEFVLRFCSDVGEHYRRFMETVGPLKEALVMSYEEVIADFAGFLGRVNQFAGIGAPEERVLEVASRESFETAGENQYAHKRSVKPGNYRTKLKAETIARLDEELADVLGHYGWPAGEGMALRNEA